MADHLILSSLQPSPFLIFPCSLRRRPGFSGGIRFSVPEFRLSSSQLQLANSTSSPQSSSSSSPDKFDLVSTTQLEDGSYFFRFGDATEIERNLETEAKVKKQNPKIAEDGHTFGAPGNSSNFIKIKDRKKVRAPTKKKKETSTSSVNLSPSEDKAVGVSNLSSVDEAVPSSSTEENVVVSEKPEPSIKNEVIVGSDNVEPLSSVVESDKVEAEIASVSNLSSVGEAVPSSSTEEKVVVSEKPEPIIEKGVIVESDNVEPLSSVVEVMVESDKVEAKIANMSNPSSIVSVAEAIPEEKVVVSEKPEPIIENEVTVESNYVEPLSSEVMEKESRNEIRDSESNGYQQITKTHMEVEVRPRSPTSQNGSQSEDLKEVAAHVSTMELDETLDATETPTITIETVENRVVEPTATAAVSPDEQLISTSEASHHGVDEIAETSVINTSEVENVVENVASTIEDEITVVDTEADNGRISETVNDTEDEDPAPETVNDTKGEDLQHPESETADLESIELRSGREEVVPKAFYLESGLASLQSPFEALAGREDAYFVSQHNWLGIADGVSQWSFEGINKGVYAEELMSNCQKIISDESSEIADPVQVLHQSVNETKSRGSSTALIAHVKNNELHIANIGDSGFMVIRNSTVLQRSSPMFHHFWYPLHVSQGDDVLKLAEVYHVNLDENDVVITATDGLFDNLYEKEIVSIVCGSLEQNLEPQKIAELVAAKAQEVGRSGTEKTPFADAAKKEGYDGHKGGKLDAVTVIVSLVKPVPI